MAPEIIELKGASTASDIWSLACTIIELIIGKPPYAEMLAMSAMFRIVEDDRPPIPERCSPELSDFLCLCFNKDPRKRPTAEELFSHVWLQKNWDPHKVRFWRRRVDSGRKWLMRFRSCAGSSTSRLDPVPQAHQLRDAKTRDRRLRLAYSGTHVAVACEPRLLLELASLGEVALVPRLGETSVFGIGISTEYRLSLDAGTPGAFFRVVGFTTRVADGSFRSGRSRLKALLLSPTTARTVADRTLSSRPPSAKVRRRLQLCLIKACLLTLRSAAIECKLCGEHTKRHAVLCKDCGLICHQRCSEFAPLPCDLRSQLLSFSRDFLPHGSRTPLSSSLPTPASPLASANGFISAVILPFKARRSKTSPPPPPEPLSLPSTPAAARRRNFSDLLRTRTRSPGSAPPASMSGRREGSVASHASNAPPSSEDKLSSMGSSKSGQQGHRASLGVSAANDHRSLFHLAGSKKDDSLLGKKVSVVETPAGTKLHRSKSHSRSESVPIKHKSSDSDCTIQ